MTLDREVMVQAGISTAVPGRRCKVTISEFSALQRVINALILADQCQRLGTERKSVFCISKRHECWMPDFCLVGFWRTVPEIKP